MEIHEKLLKNNQEIADLLSSRTLSKEELGRELKTKNDYSKQLLNSMKDQIIDCYQLIENNATKEENKLRIGGEESKGGIISIQESYQN